MDPRNAKTLDGSFLKYFLYLRVSFTGYAFSVFIIHWLDEKDNHDLPLFLRCPVDPSKRVVPLPACALFLTSVHALLDICTINQ